MRKVYFLGFFIVMTLAGCAAFFSPSGQAHCTVHQMDLTGNLEGIGYGIYTPTAPDCR